jgi:hypothetical protein
MSKFIVKVISASIRLFIGSTVMVVIGAVYALSFVVSPVLADTINIDPIDANTARDSGPQDGIFDFFITGINGGQVFNNGFNESRVVFEFDISAIPNGSTINTATLSMSFRNFEGTRQLQLHSFTGDGVVQLTDFSIDAPFVTTTLGPVGDTLLTFDVKSMIESLVNNNQTIAGFNFRESPANCCNFLIMHVTALNTSFPNGVLELYVDYSPANPVTQVPIDIKPGENDLNCINPKSNGNIPVAILGGSIDVNDIYVSTIEIDNNDDDSDTIGVTPVKSSYKDVNGDLAGDLIMHFKTPELNAEGLLVDGNELFITGELTDGMPIFGSDFVFLAGGPSCFD